MHDTLTPIPYVVPDDDMPVDFYPTGDSVEDLRRRASASLGALMDATERQSWDMADDDDVNQAQTAWLAAQDAYHRAVITAHHHGDIEGED